MRELAGILFSGMILLGLMSWAPAVSAAGQDGVLLDGPEGKALSLVTGFHSVRHKKSGFDAQARGRRIRGIGWKGLRRGGRGACALRGQ